MNDKEKRIAELLKARRAELKMSVGDVVAQLAERGIRVAPKTFFGWENAVSRPNVTAFLALCRIYGIDEILDYFEDSEA